MAARESIANTEPERITELWFEDAPTVFRAGNKLFRLHNSILAARSSVIRDILAALPPAGKDRAVKVNGCPLIQLDDDGNDAYNFFLAIYDSGFFERPPSPVSLEAVLAIARLGYKYEVKYLLKRSLAHLQTHYPTSFLDWEERLDNSTFDFESDLSLNVRESLQVLKTVDEVAAPWLLPAVFNECCQYELKTILSNPEWIHNIRDGLKDSLLLGYIRQMDATRDLLKFLLRPAPEGCLVKDRCSEIKRKCAEVTIGWNMSDPFGIWEEGDWLMYMDGVCDVCLADCRALHEEARKRLWESLPGIYGLPPWPELYSLENVIEID